MQTVSPLLANPDSAVVSVSILLIMKKQKNTKAAIKLASEITPIITFVNWNCMIANSNGTTSNVKNPIAEAPP